MNEKTNSHDACDQNRGGLSASAPHLSSMHRSFPGEPLLQLECKDEPVKNGACSKEKQPNDRPPCDDFEETSFCPRLPSLGLASLAFRTCSIGPQSDVLKRGYLGKQELKHRKYFVLRTGSHSGPSRLEWYKTEESFIAVEKSGAETGRIITRHKRGVIFLRCCLGVSLMSSPRKDYKVALFAKDQTLVIVGQDHQEQREWYTAVKDLMEEELADGDREGLDEEDAGYCTLPPASFYKQVWPVTVKSRGLGRSKALAGELLLCLTASALVLVRIGHDLDLPSVTLPLLTVRRFGHLDGSFFLELGRSAPHGPGEIWMEPKDEVAQQIHEVVREVVRALRVIPDFNWSVSPSKSLSSHSQSLFAMKRSRTKPREKLVHSRANGSPPLPPVGLRERLHSQNQSEAAKVSVETQNPESVSLSVLGADPCSEPEPDSYMEMKTDHSPLREYMLMSPRVTHSLHQDEYVAMTSPQKHDLTQCESFSFLQTSFSSGSDVQSPPLVTEQTPPPWTLYSGRQSNTRAVSAWATSSPVSRTSGLRPVSLFSRRPMEPVRPDTEQSVKNCLLSCLPSCLQSKTNG